MADQLRLYSLYVKNKQKVELFLPSPSGSLKGKKRDQKEEEESRGILQRPLEQLDLYQRFLGDMMQECDQDAEQERQSLHAAQELVGSLVLHGKNLLAAEAIRGFEPTTDSAGCVADQFSDVQKNLQLCTTDRYFPTNPVPDG
ncbi:unnamed protein product [Ranitomeya imitator]|uniref:Uncharacterized protein n=1 Tax=Ranitomeya imitator TaxID=111125 RepID=A0ABN9M9Z4_9NEOB|nr:unnamed protein product [Ranitomeya imitator]